MHNDSPIGVFDSGMGGLSVLRLLRESLPQESFVYFGDGANCPYGDKDNAEVAGYIESGVKELMGRGVKMIVLACNTATVVSVKRLRELYDIPFVGMEPAIKPAVESTESGRVGVLATRSTLGSEWFGELKRRHQGTARIVEAEGKDFVGIVESGAEETPLAHRKVEEALRPLIDAGVDRIVLGCTHYPFLEKQIRTVIGDSPIQIIDPAPAIVRRVEWLLDELGLRAGAGHRPEYTFLTAAGEDYLSRLKNKSSFRSPPVP